MSQKAQKRITPRRLRPRWVRPDEHLTGWLSPPGRPGAPPLRPEQPGPDDAGQHGRLPGQVVLVSAAVVLAPPTTALPAIYRNYENTPTRTVTCSPCGRVAATTFGPARGWV